MRNFINIVDAALLMEDQPRREYDPGVVKWLEEARRRPDLSTLYLHGSRNVFDRFNQPDTSIGQLIFASRFDDRPDRALQAEHYGPNLYLVRFHCKRPFNPLNDPHAKKIMAEALGGEYRWEWSEDGETRIYSGVWDYKAKMEYGRLDYQDCHLVVPPAVAAGYDAFRVFECSIMDESFGCANAGSVEIIDRYPFGME